MTSEHVRVTTPSVHTAHVLLEGGPRTLRPNGLAVLELVSRTFHSSNGRRIDYSILGQPTEAHPVPPHRSPHGPRRAQPLPPPPSH